MEVDRRAGAGQASTRQTESILRDQRLSVPAGRHQVAPDGRILEVRVAPEVGQVPQVPGVAVDPYAAVHGHRHGALPVRTDASIYEDRPSAYRYSEFSKCLADPAAHPPADAGHVVGCATTGQFYLLTGRAVPCPGPIDDDQHEPKAAVRLQVRRLQRPIRTTALPDARSHLGRIPKTVGLREVRGKNSLPDGRGGESWHPPLVDKLVSTNIDVKLLTFLSLHM